MDSTVAASVIGAIGLIVVAVFSYLGGRSVSRANTNSIDAKTIRELMDEAIKKHKTIIDLQNDIDHINEKLEKLEKKNTVLWQYVYTLIDFIKQHKLTPPAPPQELESDPKLVELLK